MARGNWRSGAGHGPAEVGSARKIIEGHVTKKFCSCSTEKEALQAKSIVENHGNLAFIVKGRKFWNVWATWRGGR